MSEANGVATLASGEPAEMQFERWIIVSAPNGRRFIGFPAGEAPGGIFLEPALEIIIQATQQGIARHCVPVEMLSSAQRVYVQACTIVEIRNLNKEDRATMFDFVKTGLATARGLRQVSGRPQILVPGRG